MRPTSRQLVAAFCDYQRKRNLSPSTISHRRFRLVALVEWLGDKHLCDATHRDLERWLDSRTLSPQTRYTYTAYTAAFYKWALREQHVRRDPTEQMIRPKLPKRQPRPIVRNDLAVAVEMADPRMACFLLLASFEGMRCAEIACLRVEDIDRERNVILVHGKGDKERLVPLHPHVLDALIRLGLPRAGYVFRRRDGWPLKPNTVSHYISDFLHGIGIDATAHRGRHTYATWLYQLSGGDLRMVQDLLGHANPASTAIYAGWAPAKAAAVVGQLTLESVVHDRE